MSEPIDNHENIFKYRYLKCENDYRILLISEKDQKAYLPYYYKDILKTYEENQDIYTSIQNVLEKQYIQPLINFKNSSFSRFRETFNLIYKKEGKSILYAFDIALELMFQYNLNPIIIAACRNSEELDLYLACLEDNQLEDFDPFEIKFEITPVK